MNEQKEWMEQILDEHRALRANLAETRSFLLESRPAPGKPGAHTWATSLSQRLIRLHDHLFRHFREEEREGMMRQLAERNPRAWRRVEALVSEHAEILADMRDIMHGALEYAEGSEPAEPRLRRKLTDVLDRLSAHEESETDLIQRLLYNDLGVGD